MGALVRLKAGALGKALGTGGASVGLFATVYDGVAHQVAVFGESAAAGGTAEGLLTCVAAQVLLELAETCKALGTERADVPAPLCM